jgi:hypothetical protein
MSRPFPGSTLECSDCMATTPKDVEKPRHFKFCPHYDGEDYVPTPYEKAVGEVLETGQTAVGGATISWG